MGHPRPPDPSHSILPSVYAAAQCAQSCVRFWNLLLQDTASVSPFGFSIERSEDAEEDDDSYGEDDGGGDDSEDGDSDAAEDEDEGNERHDLRQADVSENKNRSSVHCSRKDGGLDVEDGEEDKRTLAVIVPLHPESYMTPRSLHWWNHHVGFAREDDAAYADVFRLPVGFFTTICEICREDMQPADIPPSLRNVEGRIISVERQVAIAIMRLASGNSLKRVSELLGCCTATVNKIVHKFTESVRRNAGRFLQWPASQEALDQIKDGFVEKHGLPNCCGAIDISHILIELPSGEGSEMWINSSTQSFSMILQAVVDVNLRFLDVCIGHPGSLTHVMSLQESSFYKKCCTRQRLNGPLMRVGDISMGEYVVGNSQHPLLRWLMTPYNSSNTVPATPRAHYNHALHSTRIAVARAFGRLKGTWRILQGTMRQSRLERVPRIIHACCILHNICVTEGGIEGFHFPEADIISEKNPDVRDEESYEAMIARENLCMYLNESSHAQGRMFATP